MLVRRSVEHDVGVRGLEHRLERAEITNVAQHEVGRVEERASLDAQLQPLKGVLVVIEHDEPRRLVPEDRATQNGADRAARTSDEDPLAGEQVDELQRRRSVLRLGRGSPRVQDRECR